MNQLQEILQGQLLKTSSLHVEALGAKRLLIRFAGGAQQRRVGWSILGPSGHGSTCSTFMGGHHQRVFNNEKITAHTFDTQSHLDHPNLKSKKM